MKTLMRFFKRAGLALALSIAAMPDLVNGQPQSLSSVNQDNSSNKPRLKDSAEGGKDNISRFIETLMNTGIDGNVGGNLAPVIGLSKPMPTKDVEIIIRQKGADTEKRGCFVVYDNVEGSAPESPKKRPVCAYFVKIFRSSSGKQTQYFRVDLNGKLEKAVLSQGKFDVSGKIVKGSGVKTDLDIESPEVRKTFEAEMKFWLKDWLKKQREAPAKKAA